MKQKIVIKVSMPCEKCRTKALKIAAISQGVISVALEGGDEKDKVVVIGERVDAAGLTSRLKKKVNDASIWSVEEVKPPKKEEQKNEKKEEKSPAYYCPTYCPPPSEYHKVVVYDSYPNTCTLM
ncbi:hypothetical protein Tsubulata_027962 [Turnera subulata]|uniref:HMA domain-containing protein n=1 Tax=Turnera subulata TaxID=218843 RepID=A0A9Q0FTG2_9ROSI|nr:hypothetical protein Tsubulata_027962 [Turnera subulata]